LSPPFAPFLTKYFLTSIAGLRVPNALPVLPRRNPLGSLPLPSHLTPLGHSPRPSSYFPPLPSLSLSLLFTAISDPYFLVSSINALFIPYGFAATLPIIHMNPVRSRVSALVRSAYPQPPAGPAGRAWTQGLGELTGHVGSSFVHLPPTDSIFSFLSPRDIAALYSTT
jgi:hypothetical protein